MLTYRDFVYAAFTDYAAAQTAVVLIPQEIQGERLKREALKAAQTDGDRVSGGNTSTEDAWISSVAKESYLAAKLDSAKNTVQTMDEMLRELDDEEREIVSRLIMARQRNAVGELAEEWGVDERTVFRAKDRALKHIARLLTGEARA